MWENITLSFWNYGSQNDGNEAAEYREQVPANGNSEFLNFGETLGKIWQLKIELRSNPMIIDEVLSGCHNWIKIL